MQQFSSEAECIISKYTRIEVANMAIIVYVAKMLNIFIIDHIPDKINLV